MSKPKSFAIGVDELVALVGYDGDNAVRVLQVKSFDDEHIHGIEVLRSSPVDPFYRTYRLDKVDRLAPVIQREG